MIERGSSLVTCQTFTDARSENIYTWRRGRELDIRLAHFCAGLEGLSNSCSDSLSLEKRRILFYAMIVVHVLNQGFSASSRPEE